MTGFGQARRHTAGLDVLVEVRSVNNRYLKLVTKTPDAYGALEPEIEATVRAQVQRGTVQVSIRVSRQRRGDEYRLNVVALESYRQQLKAWLADTQPNEALPLEALLGLPGVAETDRDSSVDTETEWPLVREALEEALAAHAAMRQREGQAMAEDLSNQLDTVQTELTAINERSPLVIDEYRQRLSDRVTQWLARHDLAVEGGDLVREVALFADRSDIAEETVRLASHIKQMRSTMGSKESSGRKLDFLTQEMFRETNTIGSKSNDLEIAQRVVTIKTAIERIREMVQNVE
jgi:uncharacterized protein (TIGR00255 family)